MSGGVGGRREKSRLLPDKSGEKYEKSLISPLIFLLNKIGILKISCKVKFFLTEMSVLWYKFL